MLEERASKTRQFFNTIAEDWDKLSSRVLGDFDLAASVARHMPVCKVAADLGCGTGNVLHAMLEKAEAVIGVDGSPRMLELARRRLSPEMERVSLRIGDLAHLPLRDEEADFASLNLVLHHVPDPEEVLGEIHRVLAPAGTLLLIDFDRHDDEGMRGEYGDHWLGFERDKLVDLLEKAGMRVVADETASVRRNLRLHIVAAQAHAQLCTI
jgi:ArsR family transcriptional regulator